MLIKDEYNKFLTRWYNKSLDTDGVPRNQPFQCADVPKAFQAQLNIRVYPFGGPDGGVWSSGKKVFDGEARCIDPNGGVSKYGRYETQTINSFLDLQIGDYVYFKDTSNNRYGHIGLFDSMDGNKIKVFNQNYSSTFCKFDAIPSNQFAKGLRIIFLQEKHNNNLNKMERDNIKNHINQYSDILKQPEKHLNNIDNNNTDEVVHDLLLALRNERQNNELKDKLIETINQSKSLNKIQHITNIRSVGNDGIADSFNMVVKALDDAREKISQEVNFTYEKLQKENSIPVRVDRSIPSIKNDYDTRSIVLNEEDQNYQSMTKIVSMMAKLSKDIQDLNNSKKK